MKTNDVKNAHSQSLKSVAFERVAKITDDGSFCEIGEYVADGEVAAQVITGTALVRAVPCCVFSQVPEIEKGAMSKAHCEKIAKTFELAEKTGVPVIGIYDSNGAKLTDGVASLDNYSSLLKASSRLSGVVPQISVIAGVCAGSAALLAMNADIVIALENSQIFLSSPFNSDKTDGKALTAAENGIVDFVAKDMDEAGEYISKLLGILPVNNIASPEYFPPTDAEPNKCIASNLIDAGSAVKYLGEFCKETHTVFARVEGAPAGVINASMDCDKLSENAASKIARFVRLCDAFSLPVITFVNCTGFEDEGGKELRAASRLSMSYSEATTAKITVIYGKAYGQGFVALCGKNSNSDTVIALEDATVSAVCPDAAVEILYADRLKNGEDRQTLKKEYLENEASAYVAAANGAVDKIVNIENLRETVAVLLENLSGKRETTLSKKHTNIAF